MLSHANITANTASIVEYLSLSASDRVMVVLPFYYVYGLSLLHTHIAVGGRLVLDNRFAFPNVVLNAMAEHEVTGFAGVPSTFAMLLHKSRLATTPLPALRYVTQAGGPMPPARLREWLRIMPGRAVLRDVRSDRGISPAGLPAALGIAHGESGRSDGRSPASSSCH